MQGVSSQFTWIVNSVGSFVATGRVAVLIALAWRSSRVSRSMPRRVSSPTVVSLRVSSLARLIEITEARARLASTAKMLIATRSSMSVIPVSMLPASAGGRPVTGRPW